MKIEIDSDTDIDYSVLNENIKKAESQQINLVNTSILKQMVSQAHLTVEESKLVIQIHQRYNRYGSHQYKHHQTKTGTLRTDVGILYNKGLPQLNGYTLVEVDLVPSILQIIQIISCMKSNELVEFQEELSHLSTPLGELLSGQLINDSEVQSIMHRLTELNNKYINIYLNKAISLSGKKNIQTIDAFNVIRTYSNLYPLEAICIPLTYSLNNLQYLVSEKIEGLFNKTKCKFVCIDTFKLYYFIRHDVVEEFKALSFVLDGVKLNIKIHENKTSNEIIKQVLREPVTV